MVAIGCGHNTGKDAGLGRCIYYGFAGEGTKDSSKLMPTRTLIPGKVESKESLLRLRGVAVKKSGHLQASFTVQSAVRKRHCFALRGSNQLPLLISDSFDEVREMSAKWLSLNTSSRPDLFDQTIALSRALPGNLLKRSVSSQRIRSSQGCRRKLIVRSKQVPPIGKDFTAICRLKNNNNLSDGLNWSVSANPIFVCFSDKIRDSRADRGTFIIHQYTCITIIVCSYRRNVIPARRLLIRE